MIDLSTRNETALANAVDRARERNIIIPTFKQMQDPTKAPADQAFSVSDSIYVEP